MSGQRPGRWDLLGEDGDPLPGDPGTVGKQATHYNNVATEIRDQVTRLRQIAEGTNTLVGKYQPALKGSAEDLADHLEQAQGRFDTVATELRRWAGVFPGAHQETGTLLRDAEDAQQTIDHHQPPTTPVDPKDDHAVAAEKQRQHTVTSANQDLARIRQRYHDLMDAGLPTGVKAIADDVAKRIDDASHDKLKDSFWDGFRNWIHEHAGLLKFIADVLTWIATAIVIVVLIVGTGGLGLAMVLTGVALLIHTMLAANGDGSWADVALDAFALATMGTGRLASSGARLALGTREGIGAYSRTVAEARAAFSGADGFWGKAAVWFKESNVLTRNLRGLESGRTAFTATVKELTEKVGLKDSMRLLARPSDWAVNRSVAEGGLKGLRNLLNFGDKSSAEIDAAITRALGKYGSGMLLDGGHDLMNLARVTFPTGFATDITFKAMNTAFPRFWSDGEPVIPAHGPWSSWAEDHATSHGGYW